MVDHVIKHINRVKLPDGTYRIVYQQTKSELVLIDKERLAHTNYLTDVRIDTAEDAFIEFDAILRRLENTLGGVSAYQAWLDQGNFGTEADFIASLKGSKGDSGFNGMSAYDHWKTQGNTGTVQDFLDSLIGPQGVKGDKPLHQWAGTLLQFENPDGSWGASVDLKGEKGDKGDTPVAEWDGTQLGFDGGPKVDLKGAQGDNTYIHLKYADDSMGLNMSDSPTGKEYVGFYAGPSETKPTETTDYQWAKFVGSGDGGTGGGDASIDDTKILADYTWSSQKISQELSKAIPIVSTDEPVGQIVGGRWWQDLKDPRKPYEFIFLKQIDNFVTPTVTDLNILTNDYISNQVTIPLTKHIYSETIDLVTIGNSFTTPTVNDLDIITNETVTDTIF